MVHGAEVLRARLRRGDGKPFALRILLPTRDAENIAALRRDVDRWEQLADDYGQRFTARTLSPDVAAHAKFAASVLYRAASTLTIPVPLEGGWHVIIAEHGDEVVGVAVYRVQDGIGWIDWLTVSPRYLVGAPTPAEEQVAGIGSTLVCATAERMASYRVRAVWIEPLDAEAERFWRARGFEWDPEHAHMVIAGDDPAATLAGACRARVHDTAEGECPTCYAKGSAQPAFWRRAARVA